MSTNTTNYNLVKPSPEDEYDIGVYNGNLDVVDGVIGTLGQSINSINGDVSSLQQDISVLNNDLQAVSDKVDELAPNMIINPSLDNGVATGHCVIKNISNDTYIISQLGNGIVNGDGNIVKVGGIAIGLTGLEGGYTHYVQPDGTLSITPTGYVAGFAKSETELEVTLPSGGRNKEYTEDMAQFFAIPGGPGTVRIKVELPLSGEADGVVIHESITPYDGTGLNWGSSVVTLTDDIGYKETNNWYIAPTSIANGTRCYYKGFVYKGGVKNIKAGVNETSAIVGKLYNEFTMDTEHVSGSTVKNTAIGSDLTAYNVSFTAGKVGEAAYFNGSSSKMLGTIFNGSQIDSNFTIEMWLKRVNNGSIAHFNNYKIAGIRNGGQNFRLRDVGGTDHSLNGTIDANEWHHVVYVRSISRGMIMYVDKQIVDTDSFVDAVKASTTSASIGYDKVANTDYFKGWICQFRYYTTDLYDDVDVLNNGGVGC